MAGAIVPFRSSGAAADQTAPHRLVQVGPICLHLHQDPTGSATLPAPGGGSGARAGGGGGALSDWLIDEEHAPEGVQWPTESAGASGTGQAHLANVGLVVWQSGLVLAELLMRRPPFGPWGKHVHVLDLGTGTGLVGLALALAGARVTLTDLPHILPLTRANVAANLPVGSGDLVVAELPWGQDPAPLIQQVGWPPDVITAADVLYDVSQHAPLLATISALSAPHTETYISYRCRSVREEGFSAAAQAAGFAVDLAPDSLLAEEYQGGAYRVLRLVRRDAPVPAGAQGEGAPGVVVVAEGGGQEALEDAGREELEHRPCRQS